MKTVTIEELLSWAFVHELTKGGGIEGIANGNSAWRMISELGTRVSTGAFGGGENYFIEQGEPHADAVEVGMAVADLRHCAIVVPVGWNPLPDWTGDEVFARLTAEAIATACARLSARPAAVQAGHLVALVVGTAVLGREPDWQAEPPKVRMVEHAGQPAWFVRREQLDSLGRPITVEVDGRNPRTRKPFAGAYRKFEFSADPAGDILGRLDHQLWVAALMRLHAQLLPRLVAHRLVPPVRPLAPWASTAAGGFVALCPKVDRIAC